MNGLGHQRLLLATSTLVFLLAGCTSAATPTASPASVSAATIPTLAVTTKVAAIPTGSDRMLVSGSMNACDWTTAKSTDDGTVDWAFTCTYSMSDPRLSEVEEGELTEHRVDQPMKIGVGWDLSSVLSGPDGAWRGTGFLAEFLGTDGATARTAGYTLFVGERAFSGLVFRMFYAGGPGLDETCASVDCSAVVSGWIEPAK